MANHFPRVHPTILTVLFVILLLGLWQIRAILMLALAAVGLTVLVSIPIRWLMRFGIQRPLAILIANLAIVVIIILISLLILPTLFDQFRVLFTEIIPEGIERIVSEWNRLVESGEIPFVNSILDENMQLSDDIVNQLGQQITSALSQLGGSVLPIVNDLANSLLGLLIVFFLSLYFLAEPQRYTNGIIRLVPLWYRKRANEIIMKSGEVMEAWIRVTGVSMIAAGAGTGIGLALLGIQQWAALGVLTGLLSFIPNFGTIVSLIPAIAVGIIQAPDFVWLIVLIILAVSLVQSQVISPILANENMNLPPVLILLGQIIAGVFFGFGGLLLAVPITALVVMLVDEIYVKDILGDNRQAIKADAANIVQHEEELLPDGV